VEQSWEKLTGDGGDQLPPSLKDARLQLCGLPKINLTNADLQSDGNFSEHTPFGPWRSRRLTRPYMVFDVDRHASLEAVCLPTGAKTMLSARKYTAMAVLGVGLAIAAAAPASARYYGYGYHHRPYGYGHYHHYRYGYYHRPYRHHYGYGYYRPHYGYGYGYYHRPYYRYGYYHRPWYRYRRYGFY